MTEAPIVEGPLQAGSPLRTPRAAALAGIVFSVLLISALVLLRISVPAHPDVPGEWLTDSGHRAEVAIALNLVPFAGIAFLWFVGVVRDRVGAREDRFFVSHSVGCPLHDSENFARPQRGNPCDGAALHHRHVIVPWPSRKRPTILRN